ncbi:quinon protein alcohol dehydrogenase-like superfamily [Suillus ampliporus]|nr:quinon protein alcohol dehydrogenase-like superfamily [Suillus ampliporus]
MANSYFAHLLVLADIQIYNPDTRHCVASFKACKSQTYSLAWTPDGTRLISGEIGSDSALREWNTSNWWQVGDPWKGHTTDIYAIAINPAGTLVASTSSNNHVRLWRLSDQRTIAIFQHSKYVMSATFSIDGTHILSGGFDKNISEWAVPEDALEEASKALVQKHVSILDYDNVIRAFFMQILAINTAARDAYITGDLTTAEKASARVWVTRMGHGYGSGSRSELIIPAKMGMGFCQGLLPV